MTPPMAEPDEHPRPRRIDAVDARVRPRLACGLHGEHDVPLEPPGVLRADDGDRIEVLDLGGDADRELARVEGADPVDPALPGDRCVPGRARVVPERSDGPEPGDDDAAHRTERRPR